jgi:large subunit ribosomal protein L19
LRPLRPTSGEIRECCSDLKTIIKTIIMADLMKFVQDELVARKDFPVFGAGDTITVYYEIKEGEKTRTQFFKGVVIQRRGSGNTETFTIRKMSGAVGVERIFPVNLPALQKIEINKKGHVRRARIFYFRELTGKKAKIRDKRR